MLSEKNIRFILSHEYDDTASLLLQREKYTDVDLEAIVLTIEARRRVRNKIPSWYENPSIEYPSTISVEQCSSEVTAKYKQMFSVGKNIVDLTGGLGIDSYFLSKVSAHLTYVEKDNALYETAKRNFESMGVTNVQFVNADCIDYLSDMAKVDMIYLDPARRGRNSEKVYDIRDCEPDLMMIKDSLLEKAEEVLVKISPMEDISRVMSILPEVDQIHVVSAANECKEILLLLKKNHVGEPVIYVDGFCFTPKEERNASSAFASTIGTYLYMPSKGMMKAGAFKLMSQRYGILKLAPSTHLYTSPQIVSEFPGRILKVIETVPVCKKNFKYLASKYNKANIIALNLPFNTESLRARLDIADGGDCYMIGCRKGDEKLIIVTELVYL